MFGLSKLKRLPRPDEPAQNFKMAALEADFLVGEELEELFVLLDGGFLDEDVDFNAEIDSMVKEVADSEEENTSGFKCDLCRKVCKSERGLARHQKNTFFADIVHLSPNFMHMIVDIKNVNMKKNLS